MEELVKQFKVQDSFIGHYRELIVHTVLPYQEAILNDRIEGIEKSHAIANFRAAAQFLATGTCEEEFYGMVFQDSDVAKWLEAAAYALGIEKDEDLEKRCDQIIALIGEAQQEDGYLDTYFTVKQPNGRWKDLCEGHELYCAGHMIEAAVAYANYTGKTKLLDIVCRMADHIYDHFIIKGAEGYPGHPEIELALMRLYEYTGKEAYQELAKHFIDVRGVDSGYFERESKKRDFTIWNLDGTDTEYMQCHMPVREQSEAVGHAVRAVYLYSGMADLARETNDSELTKACIRLWENVVNCKMYVTGSIGSTALGEAFTKDYDLPNDTAYAETCAAIGLIFFAKRMLLLKRDSRYADTMERALYNGVLAGMQQDGKRFFYVNPLEVVPGISGEAITHKHALPTRPEWYACACCPPNVARLLTSIASYAWSIEGKTVYSDLFIGGELDGTKEVAGKIHIDTSYPFEGSVTYSFEPVKEEMDMTLAIRLPYWSKHTKIYKNGEEVQGERKQGYAYLSDTFTKEDRIVVKFDMAIRKVYASPKVAEDTGKVCIMRGPIVYCAEGIDNGGSVLDLQIRKELDGSIQYFSDWVDAYQIECNGVKVKSEESLYSFDEPKKIPYRVHMIPYFMWGNRGVSQMRVWIPEE